MCSELLEDISDLEDEQTVTFLLFLAGLNASPCSLPSLPHVAISPIVRTFWERGPFFCVTFALP
jgi:hypothetical protein